LQFYARGLFASPAITSWRGQVEPGSMADQLRSYLWGGVAVLHSLLDWPLRNLSGEEGCCGMPCAMCMLWSCWEDGCHSAAWFVLMHMRRRMPPALAGMPCVASIQALKRAA